MGYCDAKLQLEGVNQVFGAPALGQASDPTGIDLTETQLVDPPVLSSSARW